LNSATIKKFGKMRASKSTSVFVFALIVVAASLAANA
jgi:hypothetical protein